MIRCGWLGEGLDEVVASHGFSGNMCSAEFERFRMNQDDFPAPAVGFVLTHFLVVADQDRSREFYRSLFDAQVVVERDPVIMKVANSWLILNVGGGPTDDKPTVTLTTPPDPNRTSAFLNVRVADIARVYQEWSAKGAEFLTEPKDHGRKIRAYIRDPDGHLIEVGQSTGILR
jgi:lactoylglutathione lyase